MSTDTGISGSIARKFLDSEITPLLALVGLLMGLFAVLVTPREEEPQIDVTFANVFIAFPGASVGEVEQLVSIPAEQVFSEIEGVKHTYSVSRPGMAILTIEYDVGQDRTRSIVRLYNAVFSNQDWLPQNLGVSQPVVKPMGIDDVPIVALTLWSDDESWGGSQLQDVAHAIEVELKRVPGTRDIYTIGGPDSVVHVVLDPVRMAGFGITVNDLRAVLQAANTSQEAGPIVRDNQAISVQAGTFLSHAAEIGDLVVGVHEGRPVFLNDVATVTRGPDTPRNYVWSGSGPGAATRGIASYTPRPAVTIAVAKKPGTNAVDIARDVITRFEQLKGTVIPEGVNMTVSRNYGETANDKAMTLITKLVFATACVVILVLLALGWREAFIVGMAVVITLMITLFASWAWGFTLNRVSLFALIFSIGILVDDAIVVVENIHRHRQLGGKSFRESIPLAVDEVGGPTILATFTVIAALLPMAFVSGLMGPYMSPIPINASMGMLISLAVAFVVTPWMAFKILAGHKSGQGEHDKAGEFSMRFFQAIISPFLETRHARRNRWLLLLGMVLLIGLSVGLAGAGQVILKMLPFDNKSEFQVVVDMPEGTPVEQTARVLRELGDYLSTVPEVTDYQAYAGTASPINFNGLVRQYYLRSDAHAGDIQVNLVDKAHRDRKSHDIARAVRQPLQDIAQRFDANVKIVEVPPGPPVMAPLVAEIYGIDYAGQQAVARQVRTVFEENTDVVDVDDSVESPAQRLVIRIDRQKAALLGIRQDAIVNTIAAATGGADFTYLHDESRKFAVPVRVELSEGDKAYPYAIQDLKVRAGSGALVPIGEVIEILPTQQERTIYHKDLLPVVFVTGDVAGDVDSPLYGMFAVSSVLNRQREAKQQDIEQFFLSQPEHPYRYSLKWDGEWQITYDTFRDMGIAYAVGIILIYLLVVAQFRSYSVPLIIMVPIPLTIIGVMPGHALLGAPFTATSMIGMIALAGIIVRNSILLVDFVNQQAATGMPFSQAVISAGAVRAKPIILTALAAMLGALFILDDPIFSGLAISLIFGILVSTILTLLVIPVMYYAFMRPREVQ